MLAMQHYNSCLAAPRPLSNQTYGVEGLQTVAWRKNITTERSPYSNPTAAGLSMTLGILFNIVALVILAKAYARLRRRSKATFLLFASSLVATDFAGHIIPGALVLRLYLAGDASGPLVCGATDAPCQFLGGSMVFFGLCPLFMGCAMAAERCLGVTRPLLHASLVSTARTKMALAFIWLLALFVALLPFFQLGAYTYQYPWTWCFIHVLGETKETDVAFVMLFSGLGLVSLAVALVCNTISGVTLVRARLRKNKTCHRRSAKSHDIEMVAQLVGIMTTSCICWSPLLIFGLMSVLRSYSGLIGSDQDNYRKLIVMGVRLASWNQILDPWVYILLRQAVLRKIYCITKSRASFKNSTFHRWEFSSFQGSEKNTVNRI